jgi:hypothetical protein
MSIVVAVREDLNLNFGPDRWLEMAHATAVAIDAVLSMTMAAANQRDTSRSLQQSALSYPAIG